MDFYDIWSNNMKIVSCIVKNLNSNSGECTLKCDTKATPLTTNNNMGVMLYYIKLNLSIKL